MNRGSLGWEGSFTLQGGALIPERFSSIIFVVMVLILEHQGYASKNELVVFTKQV